LLHRRGTAGVVWPAIAGLAGNQQNRSSEKMLPLGSLKLSPSQSDSALTLASKLIVLPVRT
jgi:hypothetical protein